MGILHYPDDVVDSWIKCFVFFVCSILHCMYINLSTLYTSFTEKKILYNKNILVKTFRILCGVGSRILAGF